MFSSATYLVSGEILGGGVSLRSKTSLELKTNRRVSTRYWSILFSSKQQWKRLLSNISAYFFRNSITGGGDWKAMPSEKENPGNFTAQYEYGVSSQFGKNLQNWIVRWESAKVFWHIQTWFELCILRVSQTATRLGFGDSAVFELFTWIDKIHLVLFIELFTKIG